MLFYSINCSLLSQQQGDEGEEGVTSEGMVTEPSEVFPCLPLATPTSLFALLPLCKHSRSLCLFPEFDKFLEERAKAAEMTPSSGEPGAVQGTPKRKKPERPDESLLAM